MEGLRKPFQGVSNIVRFNWHFYAFAVALLSLLFLASNSFDQPVQMFGRVICLLILASIVVSLLVSFYVYDLSGLYNLDWIEQTKNEKIIVNINAGFDETSHLLQQKFKNAQLIVLDFYDPVKHTEISIKRARKAYPPFPNTQQIETTHLPLVDNSVDKIFVILSAHEIRNEEERMLFFREFSRVLKPSGQIYVTEHLRDCANFFAYNLGFFHFYSKNIWYKTFIQVGLQINQEIKITPFISTFILCKNGNTF